MIPPRGRDLSADAQFSFTSSTDLRGGAPRHGRRSSPFVADHGPRAQMIKDSSYRYPGDRKNLDPWTRRASFSNYGRSRFSDDLEEEEEDLTCLVKEEENRSGTPSPPLWKNAGGSPSAPRSAGASPVHAPAGQLARFRQEMVELVRDMPESGYELSLRDMVQPLPRASEAAEVKMLDKKKNKKTNQKAKQIARTESMVTGGFLLKMFTPASMAAGGGGGSRRRNSSGSYSFARVSPKPPPSPPAVATAAVNRGQKDGEWWRKKELSGSSGGSSSSSSSKSSSSSSKSKDWKNGGCYSFLLRTRSGEEDI